MSGADPLFFRDLSYVLIAAVAGGLLARLVRQPLIVGFVVGGMLIGPFTPGPAVSDLHTFELFAELGVVLLMFSIGIEFSLKDLLRVKWVALIGGPLGIALTIAVAMGAGAALGWRPLEGAGIGIVISVASTMAVGQREPGRLVAVGAALLRAAVILVPFVYLSAKVVPRVLGRVAATRSDELFLLVAPGIRL